MAGDEVYTLGRWLVKAGQEATFIHAWKELGAFFLSLPEPQGQARWCKARIIPVSSTHSAHGPVPRQLQRCEGTQRRLS